MLLRSLTYSYGQWKLQLHKFKHMISWKTKP